MNKKNNPDNTFSVEDPEHSSGFLLWQVTTLWQRKLKKKLETLHGISHSQYVILANIHWLTLNGEEVTQIKLSEHTKIEPMNVSKILQSLKNQQLIERMESKKDSRAKSVLLTNKGKDLIKKAVPTIENEDTTFFEILEKEGIGNLNSLLLSLLKNKSEN